MDPVEAKNRQLLKDLSDGKDPFNQVQPGDETKPANSIRNYVIDKTGMPQNWMENTADYKNATAALPQQMGMGTMGTVGNTTGMAEGALAKLMSAQGSGQKLSAAEQYLLGKATGQVPVVKTAQEMAEPAFAKLKGLMGK